MILTFTELPLGARFEFYSRRFDKKAERGPWIKTGERTYRCAESQEEHELGTPSARVDAEA
jgi:hypothetical protein